MSTPKLSETSKALAIAIAERCQLLELNRSKATDVARNMFLGARAMARISGDEETVQELTKVYNLFIEFGYSRVLKWAGIHETVGDAEPEKEAA